MDRSYCHPEPLLSGFPACANLEAAAAMAYECSTCSPPFSAVMQQLEGSFPPSFLADANARTGGVYKGTMLVSTQRSSSSTSLGSAQEMDVSGSSSRKTKRRSNANVAKVTGKRVSRGHDEEAAAAAAGCIHVRARRGQATDGHSVAERLRREKINEKMKMLQSLVPGCEKLAGKALLDEIISYAQSLQSQVEFMSMKLAYLNPMMVYELGLDTGGLCHADAPQVLETGEMPPHEEAVQWMGQATAGASHSAEGATARFAQMHLELQLEEEDELDKRMSLGFFQQ